MKTQKFTEAENELIENESIENESINEEEVLDEENSEEQDNEISFSDLGLNEIILEAIKRKGFIHPSPIQILAIPRLLNGDANVIARARTGTGKTAAFGLPIVQTLREDKNCVRAIILEPTRELAMQTATEMASFSTGRFPRTAVVYGGASIGEQIRSLKKGCDIVVGTPGRVQDLIERGVLNISHIEFFILDEGDEMLDMGFVDDIENIFSSANPDCRVLLFSATIPAPILKIAQKFMGEYEIVEEEGVVEEPLAIEQKYWVVRESEKIEALVRLIDISRDFYGLVFVQKKSDADTVSKILDEKGYEVAALHGDIPQGQREKILSRFRAKKTRVLVATDVAARGIDIEGLTHVVNYELPFDGPTYVHRIGRTGRAGSSGMAVTFVRPEECRRKLQYLKSAVRKSAKGEMTEGKIPSVDEVLKEKKERLFDEIKKKLSESFLPDEDLSAEEKKDSVFDLLAEELCSGQNPQEVVSSLLSVTYGNALNKNRYGKINVSSGYKRDGRSSGGERNSSRREREIFVKDNQIRLYVQLGWRDGYNPKKIASFFCGLLHIRSKDVDAIDMADRFCLVSLPKEKALKALDMAANDKSLPHMHQDSKVTVEYSERNKVEKSVRNNLHKDEKRTYRKGSEINPKASGDKGRNHSRARVHTGTKRNSKAAIYKKSANAVEF